MTHVQVTIHGGNVGPEHTIAAVQRIGETPLAAVCRSLRRRWKATHVDLRLDHWNASGGENYEVTADRHGTPVMRCWLYLSVK